MIQNKGVNLYLNDDEEEETEEGDSETEEGSEF